MGVGRAGEQRCKLSISVDLLQSFGALVNKYRHLHVRQGGPIYLNLPELQIWMARPTFRKLHENIYSGDRRSTTGSGQQNQSLNLKSEMHAIMRFDDVNTFVYI